MGKIYEYRAYVFFFYSNDHKPIHVHVRLGERLVKVKFIEFNGAIALEMSRISKARFSRTQISEIEDFCRTYSSKIISKWNQQFEHGKKPKFEKIKG